MLIFQTRNSERIARLRQIITYVKNENISSSSVFMSTADRQTDICMVGWDFSGTLHTMETYVPCSGCAYNAVFSHDYYGKEGKNVVQAVNDYLMNKQNISSWNFFVTTFDMLGRPSSITGEYWQFIKNPLRKKLPMYYSKFLIRTKLLELLTRALFPNFSLKLTGLFSYCYTTGLSSEPYSSW